MAVDKFIHELDQASLQVNDLIPIDRETSPGIWSNYKVPFSMQQIIITYLNQSQIVSLPSPMTGQLAVATDTFQLLVFNGSEWQISA